MASVDMDLTQDCKQVSRIVLQFCRGVYSLQCGPRLFNTRVSCDVRCFTYVGAKFGGELFSSTITFKYPYFILQPITRNPGTLYTPVLVCLALHACSGIN